MTHFSIALWATFSESPVYSGVTGRFPRTKVLQLNHIPRMSNPKTSNSRMSNPKMYNAKMSI